MKAITKTNFVKNIFFLALTLASFQTFAQEDEKEKKFSFNGSVDAYYRYNFSDNQLQSPTSSFANLPGFSLGMANLIASYEGEKVGFVADLVFGPRGTDAVFLSPFYSSTAQVINQLYMYWNVNESVKLTFGNFNTFLGYEVISPAANFNYSTSYMFSYGPFSHTGLKADVALNDDWSLMLAVMNPTDFTETNFTDTYTFGAQLGYSGTYLNFLYGKGSNDGVTPNDKASFQTDLTTGFDVSDKFYLGLNATYFDTDGAGFYGAAIYPQYKTSENFALGLRAEYFKEFEGGVGALGTYDTSGDANVFDLTLTGSYSVGDLTFKPELRLDSVSEDVFADKDGILKGSLSSFVLAAIYSF